MSDRTRFAVLGYALVVYLVVVPVADVVANVLPANPGSVRWRYGTIGLFSRAADVPALGLFLAVVLATRYRQTATLRGLGAIALVAVFGLGAVVVLFATDALSIRYMVTPEALDAMIVSTTVAATRLTSVMLIALCFAWYGLRTRGFK